MLRDALAYPRSDGQWLRRLGIGGVVILGSFLLVPLFIFFGYIVRVLRSVTAGQTTPPDFDGIGSLTVDGIKFYGITFAYGLPVILIPIFAGAFGQALGLGTSVAGSDPGAGPVATSIIGLLLLGTVVAGAVSFYSVPAAVCHFAYTGSMKAAFDVRTVVGTVSFSGPYLKAYFLTAVIGIVLFPVVAALSVVLVGIFIAVYQALVAGYLIGNGYAVSRNLPQDGHTIVPGTTPAGAGQQTGRDAAGQGDTTPEPTTPTTGAKATQSSSGACPECGRSVGTDASFCPDCGTEITHVGDTGEDTTGGPQPPTDSAGTSGQRTTDGQTVAAQRDEATSGPQAVTQTSQGTDPHPEHDPDGVEPDSAPDSGDPDETDAASSSPAQVSQDQLYTDETGTTYVETSIGPDKQLHVDSDGHHFYQRGRAMRAVSGGFTIICAGFALFAFFMLPGMAGGPNAPRGRFFFALIEAIPFGNVLIGLLAIWIGSRLAYIAYTGREYMDVEETD
ncbi:DUF4013 family protein [Natronomonas moolapensis 8.8.11]|uniref:DUF4013 family protein n=1 Tax=Natronomonas moolapensis (strain DSM 18674 / CECT 7526 / JCM 14361 / 8.8.11) TaxID=268739 RepID=M1XPQ4_NATM8|nr:DUF4013 domain-containing protein [Natronomonas moolapensis]CCQ36033.1 DUF4013 family protein [Natronomonas moolapensis 8.8.11]